MNQKVRKPSSRRTASDIPTEDLDLFLDTHGWKNEPNESREKTREYILHFYLTSIQSRQVRLSEVRKRLMKLKAALTNAADGLSIVDYVDFEVMQAIFRQDPEFRCPSMDENLRRLADLCDDAWSSSKKMDGGRYRDTNARRFANNCYHFLRKCHPKCQPTQRVTKALLKGITRDLYELFNFAKEPGLQRAADDVWQAHKRYKAGQDPYITGDARLWFSAQKAKLEPAGFLVRPLGVPYPEYDW